MSPPLVADSAMPLFLAAGQWGRNHMLLYGIGFFVLLMLLAWVARRLFAPGASLRLGPGPLAVISCCLLVFAGVAAALELQPVLTSDLDQRFLAAMATVEVAWAVALFAFFTRLADPPVLAALCIGITLALLLSAARHSRKALATSTSARWLAARESALAFGWVMAVAGNAVLNPGLKAVFARSRPLHDNVAVFASGLSFPSGHTSGAVVAYGMLAFVVVRWLQARSAAAASQAAATAARPFDPATATGNGWRQNSRASGFLAYTKANLPYFLTGLAAYIAWNVGWSRLVLQVHFPTDVIAGFASGTAWLTVCILVTDALLRRADAGAQRSAA